MNTNLTSFQFKFITLLPALFLLVSGAHCQKPLKEQLWQMVKPCYSMFEDVDDDGKLDMSQVTDDSANGFLSVSGSWPTCGCECSSQVGAYKHADGSYTLLQTEEFTCDWTKLLQSNRSLNDILPEGFGINAFMREYVTPTQNQRVVFYLETEIPQVGTNTKVSLRLIPFGMDIQLDNQLLCYGYSLKEDKIKTRALSGIRKIASGITNDNTLTLLAEGAYTSISAKERAIINQSISKNENEYGTFKSVEELTGYIKALKNAYDLYSAVESASITLGWDKSKGRFYIKEKSGGFPKISFKKFLIQNEYWSPVC